MSKTIRCKNSKDKNCDHRDKPKTYRFTFPLKQLNKKYRYIANNQLKHAIVSNITDEYEDLNPKLIIDIKEFE